MSSQSPNTSSTPLLGEDEREGSSLHHSASTPPRPQLHIDTTTPVSSHTINTAGTPPRSRDSQRTANFDPTPIRSGSASIRSQRSEAPRVRFSSDVQTLGERTVVSPSITAEDALARLNHPPSQSTLSRRQGSITSDLPYLPVTNTPPQEQIKGILRSPSSVSGGSLPERRPTRPRGWSLRRQLFSKQDPTEQARSPDSISLTTLPPAPDFVPVSQPRPSRSIEDIDAIRVVNTALDQARVDPPVTPIHPKSPSFSKKIQQTQPEVTQASLPFYSTWASSHRRHLVVEKCKDLMRRIKRLRDPRLLSKGKGRIIPIDIPERGKSNLIDQRTGREYVDNQITSSRYTVASFLPRQLWAQFSKVANLYFTF
jgi:phospholipid-translocating ATPase